MQAPTIKDVARAAGVSAATASRVLSGHPATSSDARAKVEAAAASLGFLPNAQARSLRSTKTDSIALLISDVRNPYFSDLAHAVEQHARAAGLVTFIGNANEDTMQQDEFLATMLSRRVDGLLVVPQGLAEGSNTPSAMLQRVISSPIPTVFVDRTVTGTATPSITASSRQALERAVADLKANGHRRIAFLGGPKHASTAAERHTAFDAALTSNGLEADEALHFAGDFQRSSGRAGSQWFLTHPAAPTAVVIADAPMALGALAYWQETGARIGRDFSVISFDEVDALLLHDPPIATISHDLERMGQAALDALMALMRGEQPTALQLDSQYTARPSVAPAPARNVKSERNPRP